MSKRILGLELGNSNMKMLECRRKGDRLIVEKSRIIQTPPDTMSDGVIWDSYKIYQLINQEIKSKKYKSKDLAIVINSSEIITRDIRMDKMPLKDLKGILELQYQEYLLVDISEYQVTFKVVGEREKGGTIEQDILLVAAPNKLLTPLVDLADRLKMKIKSINIASDAISHLFGDKSVTLDMKEKEAVVIDIGGTSSTVTIVSDGVGVLSKDIRFGLRELDDKINNEFGSKQVGDLERFKSKYGGIYEQDPEGDIYEQFISGHIIQSLDNKLMPEVRRLLQFHFSRGKKEPIEKIYIIGGGASLKNIDQYINEMLEIPSVAGMTLDETQVECNTEFQSSKEYFANILGLISEI